MKIRHFLKRDGNILEFLATNHNVWSMLVMRARMTQIREKSGAFGLAKSNKVNANATIKLIFLDGKLYCHSFLLPFGVTLKNI